MESSAPYLILHEHEVLLLPHNLGCQLIREVLQCVLHLLCKLLHLLHILLHLLVHVFDDGVALRREGLNGIGRWGRGGRSTQPITGQDVELAM